MTNEELYYLPASELLKHIQAEKEHLIKEKVIKKSKPLPPITEEEKPYELPEGWEWVRLSDVINIVYGTRIVKKTAKEGDYPVYGGGDITFYVDTYNRDTAIVVSRFGLSKKCTRYIKGRFFLNDSGLSLHTFNEMCLRTMYIKFLIESLQEQIFELSRGAAQRNLDIDKFNNLLIPLPPLYIQDQIIQKLEKLSETKDSLLSHADSQLNYTKKMREALLQEAIRGELVPQDENDEPASVLLEKIKVEKERLIKEKVIKKQKELPPITDEEKPYELPKGWEWGYFEDLILISTDYVANGSFKSLKDNVTTYKTQNYALLVKTQDFNNNFSKDLTYIDFNSYEFLSKSKLYGGELMLSNIGASIGKVFIIPNLNIPMSLAPNSIMVKCTCKTTTNYLKYLMLSFYGQEYLKKLTEGTAMPKFSKTQLRNMIIPIPPLAEQERIVEKLNELMANCDQLEAKAEEMKNYTIRLFEASLKEAFMPE